MSWRATYRAWRRNPAVSTGLFVVGVLLIIVSPVLGAIPGPGGIFVFAGGLALTLQNSRWAKRQYVRFKAWQPKAGRWADWGLRRRSAQRREERRKQREDAGCEPIAAPDDTALDKILPDPPQTPLDELLPGTKKN